MASRKLNSRQFSVQLDRLLDELEALRESIVKMQRRVETLKETLPENRPVPPESKP